LYAPRLKKNESLHRAREYAKFHALRQYGTAHTAIKVTTQAYLLPSLSGPFYVSKARTALRNLLNVDGSNDELLEHVRGVELLYNMHERLEIPPIEREQFNNLCFTVMQKSIAWDPLQDSERGAMDEAIQWVRETEPLELPNDIVDQMVSAYKAEAEAQIETCIQKDVDSKSCCVQ